EGARVEPRGGVHARGRSGVGSGRRRRMREIVDGIFTWTWFSEPHGYDFNGYLIRHPEGNLCVDPVEPSADVLARLAQRGVARMVLTNRNHVRKAALVRERTGAPIAIHPADADYARAQGVTIDAEIAPGEQIGSFTVLGVPGKSPGEIALHCPRRRILVVGDAVIGNPPGKLSLLREKVMDDPPLLRASAAALAKLDVEVPLPGDGADDGGSVGESELRGAHGPQPECSPDALGEHGIERAGVDQEADTDHRAASVGSLHLARNLREPHVTTRG